MTAPASGVAGTVEWADALLTSGSEALLGAVRNYLGPVKTPYDKRELVRRLELFLRRPETQDAILALLDPLDARILGACLILGPIREHELKELFVGEVPLFELGVRIANLYDRLLLFRVPAGSRARGPGALRAAAVTPLLEQRLRERILDAEIQFGLPRPAPAPTDPAPTDAGLSVATAASEGPEPAQDAAPLPVDSAFVAAFFSFLFHSSAALRKGGGLTKRGVERAQALFPRLSGRGGEGLDELARAFGAAGILVGGGEDKPVVDRAAFAALLSRWGGRLPFYLAAALAQSRKEAPSRDAAESAGERDGEPAAGDVPSGGAGVRRQAELLASALEAFPSTFAFSQRGLERWLRIAARLAAVTIDGGRAVQALRALGVLAPGPGGRGLVASVSGRAAAPAAGADAGGEARAGRTLVAEGAHALHLLPEASLEDRCLVGTLARLVVAETVWTFELDRETARRAFAAGLEAAGIKAALERMAGGTLPQSLAFSLSAWEEEYRSLRLYRGITLVADERLRPVIERSQAMGLLVAERLGPGVYFLASSDAAVAAEALARAGLEAPPLSAPWSAAAAGRPEPGLFDEDSASARSAALAAAEGAARTLAAGGGTGAALDPAPFAARLRREIDASARSPEEKRELAERLERRLVLTRRQIEAADPRIERLEAGGLDYLGKVRIIERALRGSGDRLEILYRLPGAEPVRALLRPVKLEKNDKGLVLEAEDLGSGGPARVPLGAVSTVRRLRASLFGEEA